MTHPNPNYQYKDTGKTPVMTIAAVLQWLDMEIEDVKALPKPNKALETVHTGIVLYLEVMKGKLSDEALKMLDEVKTDG